MSFHPYHRGSETRGRRKKGIGKPRLAKLSEEWIRAICEDWPQDFRTYHLHTMLIIANCAGQIVRNGWKVRGKEYWEAKTRSIPVNLNLENLCGWCKCDKERYLRKRLKRLMQPIGPYPPLLKKYKIWPNTFFGHMTISLSIDSRYAHCPPPYTEIKLPVPIGSRSKAKAHLRSFVGRRVCNDVDP